MVSRANQLRKAREDFFLGPEILQMATGNVDKEVSTSSNEIVSDKVLLLQKSSNSFKRSKLINNKLRSIEMI